MNKQHADLLSIHLAAYIADSDPGAVGAGKAWVDTGAGAGAWVYKVRNDADDGWEVVAGGPVARATTTDATPGELFLDGVGERLILSENHACAYTILIVARKSSGTEACAWKAEGLINRPTGGNIALFGDNVTVIGSVHVEYGCTVVVDTGTQALVITGTGAASTTIHWLARFTLVDVS